ncbi:MAG TPA: hypothetical protein VFB38_04510 [Chthonomonadaceae bacterium]|nr:hypothetical protein [Chthonomonadaceae bacterium]
MSVPPWSALSAQQWLSAFADPPPAFGPLALWLWNAAMDRELITRQLQMLREQGLYSVLLRAGKGLRLPFGSAEWHQRVAFAISEAARLGMAVWLHMDGPGSAGATLAAPETQAMESDEERLQGQELIRAEMAVSRAADWAQTFTEAAWPAETPVALLLARPDGSDVRDLTAFLPAPQKAPSLPVEDTAEGWRLIAFYRRPRPAEEAGALPLDFLSPQAADVYLRTRFAPYASLLQTPTGEALRGFVVGTPHLFVPVAVPSPADTGAVTAAGAIPWTADFPQQFARRKGYDLHTRLPALWEDMRDAPQVRGDYYEALSELMAERFYAPLRRWCADQGRPLATLAPLPDTLAGQTLLCGHPLTFLRALDVSGYAGAPNAQTASASAFPLPPSCTPSTQAASASVPLPGGTEMTAALAVAAAGSRPSLERGAFSLVGVEAGWGQALRDLKAQAEHCLVSGANRVILPICHAAAEGERRRGESSFPLFQNPCWPLFAAFAGQQRRLAYALAQGTRRAEIGLYYPLRAAWAALPPGQLASLAPDRLARQGEALSRTQDIFQQAYMLLRANQWEVALLDDHALLEAEVTEGALRLDGQTLRVIVLPDVRSLSLAVARRLRAFVESGGLVATVGSVPMRGTVGGDVVAQSLLASLFADGVPDLYGNRLRSQGSGWVARIPAGMGPLRALLAERVPARVRLTHRDPGIRHTHRAGPDFDLFFLACLPGERRGTVQATFLANGVPLRLDPETGLATRLIPLESAPERRTLPIDLSSGSALIAFVGEGLTGGATLAEQSVPLGAWTIGHGWAVTLAGTLLQTDLRPWAELGQPFFTGRAEYNVRLYVPSRQEVPYDLLLLDLGDVREWAQVWINGVRVGERLWPPYVLDITRYVGAGVNELQVIVGNTPANALLHEERVSGLLGPVTLRALQIPR